MTCCKDMAQRLKHSCTEHDRYECPDTLMDRHEDGSVGIIIKDGGTSMVLINFCPWCGTDVRAAETDE